MIIGLGATVHGTGKNFVALLFNQLHGYAAQALGDHVKLEITAILNGPDSSFFMMLDKLKKVCRTKEEEDEIFNLCLKYRKKTKVELMVNNSTKEEFRLLMQLWGTEVRRNEDPNRWINKLNWNLNNFFITDVRFPNEIDYIRSVNGTCIFLENNNNTFTVNHSSEGISPKLFDYIIPWDKYFTLEETYSSYVKICNIINIKEVDIETFATVYTQMKKRT